MSKIIEIRSGGQSGADRGAMDAGRACGLPISGWCPAGGWAEDYPTSPGVLELYPEMIETPLADVIQRTEWNIRDSSCCIVFNTSGVGTSPGTDAGYAFYEKYGIPNYEINLDSDEELDAQIDAAITWLDELHDDAIVLGIGGPRASEYPGIYDIAYRTTAAIIEARGQ